MAIVNCVLCNNKFEAFETILKKGFGKYCSTKCKITAINEIRIKKGFSRKPIIERLLKRCIVNKITQCWEWQGCVRNPKKPYGHIGVGSRLDGTRKSVYAHRLSYEIHIGPIENNLLVCHKCDNPRCINPDHLFLGTHQDNVDDCIKKGRKKLHIYLVDKGI